MPGPSPAEAVPSSRVRGRPRRVLAVFLKYPEPGRVKTRLAKRIGPQRAALLYRLLAEAVIRRTGSEDITRVFYCTPGHRGEDFLDWLGRDAPLRFQEGRDLGERLSSAFRQEFSDGAASVVVIGTDSPLISSALVMSAFRELETCDCVLGPSSDGGYYLLGLCACRRELFEGIDWSTGKVLSQTLEAAGRLDLSHALLEEHFDVDDADGLSRLEQALETAPKADLTGLEPLQAFLAGIR